MVANMNLTVDDFVRNGGKIKHLPVGYSGEFYQKDRATPKEIESLRAWFMAGRGRKAKVARLIKTDIAWISNIVERKKPCTRKGYDRIVEAIAKLSGDSNE